MNPNAATKVAAASAVLRALLIAPAPLPPPHRLAEVVQGLAGTSWKAAYLVTAMGLHVGLSGS